MRRQVRLVVLLSLAALPAWAEAPAPDQVDGKGWRVRAKVVTASGGDKLEVRVDTIGSFHLNDDYPFRLDTAGDVTFDKARVDRKDAQLEPCVRDASHKCALVFQAPFSTKKAGRAGGTIAFSACNDEQCQIQKIAVSTPVAATK
jgi:hypothetical protein